MSIPNFQKFLTGLFHLGLLLVEIVEIKVPSEIGGEIAAVINTQNGVESILAVDSPIQN